MKKLLIGLMLMIATSAYAEKWIMYDNKSYVGGYYFAVCTVCNAGTYNNDSGYWACTSESDTYKKGCAKGIWEAMKASPEVTEDE